MKSLFLSVITLTFCALSFNVYSCDDKMADDIVLDRLSTMAKRYSTTKVGVGVSILWGDTRMTSISILDGIGGDDGKRIDRMGSIFINMDTCVVKAKLIGTFDVLDLQK